MYYGKRKLLFGYYNGKRVAFMYGASGVVKEDTPDTPDTPDNPVKDIKGYWLWNDVDGEGIGDDSDFSARYYAMKLVAPLINETTEYYNLNINQSGRNLSYGSKMVYNTDNYPVWIDEGYRLINIKTSYHDIVDYSAANNMGYLLLGYLERFAIRVVRFYIGESDYLAKEGITWREFANSLGEHIAFGYYDYAPPDITFDGNNAVKVDGYYIRKSNGETVYADDLIECAQYNIAR